ncbi:MAG: hypothetical protein AAF495_19595 [Pseudomonadota bacterium]
MAIRLPETIGTEGNDVFNTFEDHIFFGLEGDDTFLGNFGEDFQIMVGGSGADTYVANNNSIITVLENGNSVGDTVVATGIGLTLDSSLAGTIDGRHLVAGDTVSGQVVFVLDFLDPENRIETVEIFEGVFGFDDVVNGIFNAPGFQGDIAWEDLGQFDLQAFETGEINETIAFYDARAAALETIGDSGMGTGDLVDIFRFFNTGAGGHFFTADLGERDVVLAELPTFNFEGAGFFAFDAAATVAEADPVFRFFNTQAGGHFFTNSEAERDFVLDNLDNFIFEGTGFQAYDQQIGASKPVFRFFNNDAGGHFFTINEAERDFVIDNLPQFTFEGIGFYAFDDAMAMTG